MSTNPKQLAEAYAETEQYCNAHFTATNAFLAGFHAALSSSEVAALREIIAHGVLRTHQLVKQLDGSVQSELVETYSAKVLAAFDRLAKGTLNVQT